jgi:high-affinity nickel-transport protein
MVDLPADWSALCALVFVLGLKHGLDADHLAAIDGMTRLNARAARRLASWCGALFALGHGAVVMAIAAAVGGAREHWQPPTWLDAAGAWISIAFLLLLGVANLRAVLLAGPGECVAIAGVKGRLLGRWARARSAWAVAAVGAVFALSFDTVSQAALFSVTAVQFGGLTRALTLGAFFVAGMLLTDGLNGWWIGRLVRRADAFAVRASRRMGLAVAGLSLGVATLGIARQLSAGVDRWAGEQALVFGAATLVLVTLTSALARAGAMPGRGGAAQLQLGVRRDERCPHETALAPETNGERSLS